MICFFIKKWENSRAKPKTYRRFIYVVLVLWRNKFEANRCNFDKVSSQLLHKSSKQTSNFIFILYIKKKKKLKKTNYFWVLKKKKKYKTGYANSQRVKSEEWRKNDKFETEKRKINGRTVSDFWTKIKA